MANCLMLLYLCVFTPPRTRASPGNLREELPPAPSPALPLPQAQISTGALLLSRVLFDFVVRTITGIPGVTVKPAWARESQQEAGSGGGGGGGGRTEGGGAATAVAAGATAAGGNITSSTSAFGGNEAARATEVARRAARARINARGIVGVLKIDCFFFFLNDDDTRASDKGKK